MTGTWPHIAAGSAKKSRQSSNLVKFPYWEDAFQNNFPLYAFLSASIGHNRGIMQWQKTISNLAKAGGAIGVLIGASVLLGWTFDIQWLKSIRPDWVTMRANTALLFLLTGVSLFAQAWSETKEATEKSARFGRWIATGCGALVVVLSAITLSEFFFNWNPGLDEFLFRQPLDTAYLKGPGRMAPAAALNFFVMNCALLMRQKRLWFPLYQVVMLFAGFVGWLGVNPYLYGSAPLLPLPRLALMSAIAFLALSVGGLCLWPERGLVHLVMADDLGGRMARRLVPTALVAPVVIGWLRLKGQNAGWFDEETGVGLVALGNVFVFGGMVWASALRLSRGQAALQQSEGKLHASQQLLRGIINSSHDAIISKTLGGQVTSWNQGAEELFGYSWKEMIGAPMTMLLPPELEHEETEILARIARGESINHFETERVRKDGSRVDVSVSISPIKDVNGNILGASKIARDITEKKRADQKVMLQLRRLGLMHQITRAIAERQDLHSIFQAVVAALEQHLPLDLCCVCLYDGAAGRLTVTCVGAVSEALARELGMPQSAEIPVNENGLSRCLRGELVHEPDTADVQAAFPQLLAKNGVRSLVIAPLQVESQVFGVLIAARRRAKSFSSGECEFLRQLSEHVALAAHQSQLYGALQQAYDDLRQSQQAVMQQERLRAFGQMASGIAHDINNAISPVVLYTDILLEEENGMSERARQRLAIIQRAGNDVAQTIARLGEFYRQREPQLTLVNVSLNDLVQQVLELTRARWHDLPMRNGIVVRVVTELDPLLPSIAGAESEVREAMINLVFNAVDAMPQGGTLTLRTGIKTSQSRSTDPDQAFVEVMDSGVGMDEATRKHCLDPFFTTKGERGTGLGLAMVYGVMQRHSGELEIDSQLGQGTSFRLIFPVAVKAAAENADAALKLPVVRMHVLLVDDDPMLLQSLRDMLELDGHRVVAASGGEAGIEAFLKARQGQQPFGAVITDLGMPYVDGRKVASAVKASSPSTPVILLTGWGQRLTREGEVPLHVDRVLSKPPRLRELREALSEAAYASLSKASA